MHPTSPRYPRYPIRGGSTALFCGLATLLCAPLIGLMPTRATVTALVIGIALAGAVIQAWRARGLAGLVSREPDGQPAPVAVAAILMPLAVVGTAFIVIVTTIPASTPVEAACLCARPDGLKATANTALGVGMLAFMLCVALLAILCSVALIRARVRNER